MSEPVTMRRLSREPAAVLEQLEHAPQGLIVTRDGVEIARLTPVSPLERAWRERMRSAGHDPDNVAAAAGESFLVALEPDAPPVSDALRDQRQGER